MARFVVEVKVEEAQKEATKKRIQDVLSAAQVEATVEEVPETTGTEEAAPA